MRVNNSLTPQEISRLMVSMTFRISFTIQTTTRFSRKNLIQTWKVIERGVLTNLAPLPLMPVSLPDVLKG
jgi:hypothetical protein